MSDKKTSQDKPQKKKGLGILFGIPLLLFISGIVLITIGAFNYMKYAFFVSRMFIGHEYKVSAKKLELDDKNVGDEVVKEEKKEKKRIFPKFGEEFGELFVESADINFPVYNGDSDELLYKGIGHYFGSRYPGENSNVVLAGHRNSLFKNLWKVKIGEEVTFRANYAGEDYDYVYKVRDIKIIKRKEESWLYPTDKEQLTLYTCYPFNYIGNAPKRYLVICDLVSGTPMEEIIEKNKEETE